MPWSNQGGGGGPWGSGPKGPWGSGPQPGGGTQPPDLEDLLRRSQDKIKNVLPGGSLGGRFGIAIALVVAAALWLGSGFFVVQPGELGVVMRFGKYVGDAPAGWGYTWPYPIGAVQKVNIERINRIDVGMRIVDDARRGTTTRDVPEESLMLTGDENIVDVDFAVLWKIKPDKGAGQFLFNIQYPEGTVKAVAESAMREVIGRSNIQPVLTGARQNIENAVQDLMQKTLDEYQSGILITQVQLQKVDPPTQVIDAFRDVQAARADLERAQNEAQTYANRVVPEARGRAAQIMQNAEAYREQSVAEATGQTARYNQIYQEYAKAPQVTRQRLYLETMERLLGGTDKIILDSGMAAGGGQGVIPYLSLDQTRPRPTQPQQQPQQPQAQQRR